MSNFEIPLVETLIGPYARALVTFRVTRDHHRWEHNEKTTFGRCDKIIPRTLTRAKKNKRDVTTRNDYRTRCGQYRFRQKA